MYRALLAGDGILLYVDRGTKYSECKLRQETRYAGNERSVLNNSLSHLCLRLKANQVRGPWQDVSSETVTGSSSQGMNVVTINESK